jgi:predicted HicB family RNase H-like nuclease
MLKYKGYEGVIDDIDAEAGCLAGNVIGIQGVITFEGATAAELEKAFRDSVDDYLEFCADLAEAPEKPFSGKFVVRLSPDLHRRASEAARKADVSLNGWVTRAVEQYLKQSPASPGARRRMPKSKHSRNGGKAAKQKISSRG